MASVAAVRNSLESGPRVHNREGLISFTFFTLGALWYPLHFILASPDESPISCSCCGLEINYSLPLSQPRRVFDLWNSQGQIRDLNFGTSIPKWGPRIPLQLVFDPQMLAPWKHLLAIVAPRPKRFWFQNLGIS